MAVITGSIDADFLLGTNLADSITGDAGNDTIDGGAGNDFIDGGSGNDSIVGGAGADTIVGGRGSDSVSAGDGADSYLFDVTTDEADTVDMGAGDDQVFVTFNTALPGAAVGRVRLTFNAADVGNGTGGQAVQLQGTDAAGNVFGLTNFFDDEGTLFSVGASASLFLFDVRDGSNSLGTNYSVVQLGTSAGDTYNATTFAPTNAAYVNGGAGNDQIRGGDVATVVGGVVTGDYLDGGAGDDTLIGGGGNDRLFGRAGNDTAQINVAGQNPLAGPVDGSDTIDLGEGEDVVRVARLTPGEVRLTFRSSGVGNGQALDTEGAGSDGGLNVRIQGEDAAGNLVSENVVSRADDEGVTFIGESIPGSGALRFDVRDISGTARGSFDIVRLGTSGADNYDNSASTLQYYTNGGQGNDTLRGGSAADFLVGNTGDDTLVGNAGNDQFLGGDGNDLILGGDGDDIADGDAGADRVFGGAGNDNLRGNDGDDIVNGEAGDDVLNGGAGNDIASGEAGNDNILGGDGNDQLLGGAGTDTLNGEDGNDLLFGADGVDNLAGGAGNDTLNGEAGDDALNGQGGDDLMSGELGNDLLLGADGNDQLIGGAGGDTLNGEAGNDFLFGEAGDDILSGELGNDFLNGGDGNDQLIGGAGADRFVVGSTTGIDFVADFNAGEGDIIDFSGVDANSGTTGDQGFTFVTSFSNVAGQMTRTFDLNNNVTTFAGDTNGDGVADFFLFVTGDQTAAANTGFVF